MAMAASSYGQTLPHFATPSFSSHKRHSPSLIRALSSRQCLSQASEQQQLLSTASRRQILTLGAGLGFLHPLLANAAGERTYRKLTDKLDGYAFDYPSGWIQVRGSGADVFFRDPVNLDENVSVEMSSPSSSRYKQVDDLGSPEEAAQKVLKQYLTEFMSTRIGVRRESKIISSSSRVADDGKLYYDIQVNVKSYANNQQLAVMPQDRVVKLEWDRRYLSVLGVENNRLYELRLQVPEYVLEKEESELKKIMDSFRVFKV